MVALAQLELAALLHRDVDVVLGGKEPPDPKESVPLVPEIEVAVDLHGVTGPRLVLALVAVAPATPAPPVAGLDRVVVAPLAVALIAAVILPSLIALVRLVGTVGRTVPFGRPLLVRCRSALTLALRGPAPVLPVVAAMVVRLVRGDLVHGGGPVVRVSSVALGDGIVVGIAAAAAAAGRLLEDQVDDLGLAGARRRLGPHRGGDGLQLVAVFSLQHGTLEIGRFDAHLEPHHHSGATPRWSRRDQARPGHRRAARQEVAGRTVRRWLRYLRPMMGSSKVCGAVPGTDRPSL